ncbi:MAG TPA: hypothetical protein VMU75_01525 [Acidimicrobiales bacterium]|nr:hypothetical protein [Acidimicrobiales bacterium]
MALPTTGRGGCDGRLGAAPPHGADGTRRPLGTFTTEQAFAQFSRNLVPRTNELRVAASRRRDVDASLRAAFSPESPMTYRGMIIIGAAARRIDTSPLEAIDVMAVFRAAEATDHPDRFFQRVVSALGRYERTEVGGFGRALQVRFVLPPHINVAPVLQVDRGEYSLARRDGTFALVDPLRDVAWLDERDRAAGARLRPAIRALRHWNRVDNMALRAPHLEVLVATTFAALPYGHSLADSLHRFFCWAPQHLDVGAESGPGFADYMPPGSPKRNRAIAALNRAEAAAEEALGAEAAGDHEAAITLWHQVLGSAFSRFPE